MSHNYLKPESDGLITRSSQDYAKDKLDLLSAYIHRFVVSMRNKQWRAINYIDLQAGPGKNELVKSKQIFLGSPLLALTAKYPFHNYWFVELGQEEYQALTKRITVSEYHDRVHLLYGDCNILVEDIAEKIHAVDDEYIKGVWPSLNLAFLDPEGLELKWNTVETLGRIKRMDIIMNFSTSGLTRNVRQLIEKGQTTTIDDFFGTDKWQHVYEQVSGKDNTHLRRALIDFYKHRLSELGYVHNKEHSSKEKVMKNTKNAQVYSLVFFSKHEQGIKFWNDAVNDIQPRLF